MVECNDTKDGAQAAPVTRPCPKCGASMPWGPNQKGNTICDKCAPDHTVYMREWRKTHPDPTNRKRKGRGDVRPTRARKIEFTKGKPCLLCDYGSCGGTNKVLVCTSGKTMEEETGGHNVVNVPIEKLEALLDANKFIVLCAHHAGQYKVWRHKTPMAHDEIIAEMIERCNR